MYLLSSVLCCLDSCLKEDLWFPCRVLKVFSVSPMYVWSCSLSLDLTVAWYMMDFVRQRPDRGHSFVFLQLHCLGVACLLVLSLDSMDLLCPSIFCFMLLIQQ